jgi:hypothetical protein
VEASAFQKSARVLVGVARVGGLFGGEVQATDVYGATGCPHRQEAGALSGTIRPGTWSSVERGASASVERGASASVERGSRFAHRLGGRRALRRPRRRPHASHRLRGPSPPGGRAVLIPPTGLHTGGTGRLATANKEVRAGRSRAAAHGDVVALAPECPRAVQRRARALAARQCTRQLRSEARGATHGTL